MKLTWLQMLVLVLIGGVLLGISFPFTGGMFPIVFIALVPIILVNFQLNEVKKWRFLKRFALNFLHFMVFNTITVWWIYKASEGGAYMAIICNSILMTLPFFFTGFVTRQLGEKKGLLTFFVMWISFEYAHYYWELSWPWLSFGHVFGNYPVLIQWYEYSGVTGGTAWVLLINILVYFIVKNIFLKKEELRIQAPFFLGAGVFTIVPIISSVIIYMNYEEKTDPIDIVVVQPNIEAYTEKFVTPVTDQLDKMFSLASEKITDQTDLVLCPETAISRSVNEDHLKNEVSIIQIESFLKENNNVPLLIGADSYRFFKDEHSLASNFYPPANAYLEGYNSAFMMDPSQEIQIYHKAKPVLGAEKVPFLSWVPSLKKYSVELGGTSGMIGLGDEPLNVKAGEFLFAPLICYESVYGDYVSYFTARGADIICVITNDGWWGDTPGYKQHRMFSRIRAIENRRSVARSANTGISCFIDQRGEIISEIGWAKEGVLQAELNRNKEITFFVRYGDVLGRISLFLALAMFIYGLSVYGKSLGIVDKSKYLKKADK